MKLVWLIYSHHFNINVLLFNGSFCKFDFSFEESFQFQVKTFYLLQLLMEPMILSALYVWCQLNRDVIVSFWFGTRFKAMYLPWVLVAFNWILRGG